MAMDPRAAMRAAIAVPGVPRDADGPVFREPWEAQAFAMVVALHERGLFTWSEWAATLAEEIVRAQAAGDPDTGETFYRHGLAALPRPTVTPAALVVAVISRTPGPTGWARPAAGPG